MHVRPRNRVRRSALPLAGLVALMAAIAGGVPLSGANFTAGAANPASTVSSARDWTAPSAALADPGSPLRGAVTLAATATDARSAVERVAIERATAAGWAEICADATAPYTCSFDTTTVADGSHDFRAVAVDVHGNRGISAVVAARVIDNRAPAVTISAPASDLRGTVRLAATASDAGTGVTSVRIERSPAGAGTWTAICAASAAPYECVLDTTTLANDLYDFRAVATDAVGNSSSALAEDVQIDNASPTGVAVTVPGTNPNNTIKGAVTIGASAVDADSGVRDVVLQWAKAGTGNWTAICSDAAGPYECRFDTTTSATPYGDYDFRAVATDRAGNSTTSSPVRARIDNTTASVSMEDPGAYLRGTVTLAASAFSSTGVASVVIERSAAGAGSWTAVCADATAPYTCALDTTALADGLYDFRARMTPTSGSVLASSVVGARRIDNSPVTGLDVQAVNGATRAGRAETADLLGLTWSHAMRPETLVPGWTGAAPVAITVRVRDAGAADAVDLLDASGRAAGMGLGAIALNGDYVRKNRTVDFAATAAYERQAAGTHERTVVTITLGAMASGGTRTWTTPSAMTWTPSATARDLLDRPVSAAPVTETGAADVEF